MGLVVCWVKAEPHTNEFRRCATILSYRLRHLFVTTVMLRGHISYCVLGSCRAVCARVSHSVLAVCDL